MPQEKRFGCFVCLAEFQQFWFRYEVVEKDTYMLIQYPYYPSCQASLLIRVRFFPAVCAWCFALSLRGLVAACETLNVNEAAVLVVQGLAVSQEW